jgi:hypothetical protein
MKILVGWHPCNPKPDTAKATRVERKLVVNRVLGSECPQCGADVIAPEWSEHVSDHCIRNVWSCDACGRGFEDLVCLSAAELKDAV